MTDLEFLEQYTRCGIYHNYMHDEKELNHKLQIMNAAISAIDAMYKKLTIYEDQWLPSKQEQIDELAKRKDDLEEWLTDYRDSLKKTNIFHKNEGIINAITEILNEAIENQTKPI